jgi:hypothetical protein
MTRKELQEKYTKKELSYVPGDLELRYKAFAPLFENLYDNKMIYHEHGIGWLIGVKNIEVTSKRFSAMAVAIRMLYDRRIRKSGTYQKLQEWKFSASWDWMQLCDDNAFYVPYVSFRIWIKEDIIKRVEKLIAENKLEEIYNVVWEEKVKAWEKSRKKNNRL